MSQVTHDILQVTHDTMCGLNILSKYQLPSSSSLRLTLFGRQVFLPTICHLITELITEVIVEQPRLHRVCLIQCSSGEHRRHERPTLFLCGTSLFFLPNVRESENNVVHLSSRHATSGTFTGLHSSFYKTRVATLLPPMTRLKFELAP